MALLLKGADAGAAVRERASKHIALLKENNIIPQLVIVRMGEKVEDLAYQNAAVKRCEALGIKCRVEGLPEDAEQEQLIKLLKSLNEDKEVNGILVLRPLSAHINAKEVQAAIDPAKDVDCMSPVNLSKLFEGDRTGFAPCTPQAVMEILEHYNISLEGKNAVIIGRSMVVGKPLSMMMLGKNATVTICHTRTRNLAEICRRADIIAAAAGSAKMIKKEHVVDGQVVVDVGINVDEGGNLCGDVDFNEVEPLVSAITPVPGGVGSVTTSVLAEHTARAAVMQNSIR